MKTVKGLPARVLFVVGFSGTLWTSLAAIVLSLVERVTGGPVPGWEDWSVITIGWLILAAACGWHTPPLLTWIARNIRSRKPSSRP